LKKAKYDRLKKPQVQAGEIPDAGYLIRLPEIRFNPGAVSAGKMAEIAKIIYSTSSSKRKKPDRQGGPEVISSILPRVMAGLVRLKQERTN